MEYKSIDSITEDELIESFDIHIASVFELESELRQFSRREAELTRKAMQANKRLNKFTILARIVEADIINEIKANADKDGKPIAPSALGEIRKSMVASDKRWQEVNQKLNEKRAEAELWGGLLNAWHSRGFRLQELAKISERTLWPERTVMEIPENYKSLPRSNEEKIETILESQNNLELD